MIRTALLLARSSPLSVLFLVAAMLTIVTVLSDGPDSDGEAGPSLAAALTPVSKPRPQAGDGPAALRIALFDPERRPDTVSGSIDDLRGLAAPPPRPVDVSISGVMIDGRSAKAMLATTGASPAWTAVGSEVGGWRVASITPEGAVLEHDGRSLALRVADRLAARKGGHGGGEAAAPPAAEAEPTGAATADALTPPDAIGAAPP